MTAKSAGCWRRPSATGQSGGRACGPRRTAIPERPAPGAYARPRPPGCAPAGARSPAPGHSSPDVGQRAHHLHVDRRGQAEIENLAHDIGRLEEEGQIRKLAVQQVPQARGRSPTWSRARPARSETRISPSNGPSVALSLIARFKPEYGSPMLSRMSVSSCDGMTLADASSPPRRSSARFPRCGCRRARGRAAGSGRRPPAGRSPGPGRD